MRKEEGKGTFQIDLKTGGVKAEDAKPGIKFRRTEKFHLDNHETEKLQLGDVEYVVETKSESRGTTDYRRRTLKAVERGQVRWEHALKGYTFYSLR